MKLRSALYRMLFLKHGDPRQEEDFFSLYMVRALNNKVKLFQAHPMLLPRSGHYLAMTRRQTEFENGKQEK